MDPAFWHERWQRNEIGFHQDTINTHLQNFWHRLNVAPRSRIFVPLCGKSRDMLWLAGLGHEVIGVEISPVAIAAFFQENSLQPQRKPSGAFERWDAGELTILCGDFFNLTAGDLGTIDAVYDRASLVALPPELRQRYAQHVSQLVPAGTGTLLVTMDYPQAEMNGPPFCVTEAEVRELYREGFEVNAVHSEDILAANPRFRERGLTRLEERVYVLRKRKAVPA